jgi:phosphopantetheine adenylyltransferase
VPDDAISPSFIPYLTRSRTVIDILERQVFQKVVVTIAPNVRKNPFSTDERMQLSRMRCLNMRIASSPLLEGLLVDFAPLRRARPRAACPRDFEYEFQFAHMNCRLAPASTPCSS